MIIVNAPLKAQEIIELLNSQDEFNFVEKKGLKLFFETTMDDKVQAAKEAKAIIKKEPWGTGLFLHTEVSQ